MSNLKDKLVKNEGQSAEIGQVFNEMSDQYTDIMDEMVPHYRRLISSMLEYLPADFKPDKILDLGCGNGNVCELSMVRFPDAEYHLVDASDDMIQLCKTRFSGHSMTYEQNLFQHLNLPSDTYDLVLAGFSLHHLNAEEKVLFFASLLPSLSAEGIFTCADLFVNKNSVEHEQLLSEWNTFATAPGKSREDWDWVKSHYETYDKPDEYMAQRSWLLEAGFRDVKLSWNEGHWGCYHAFKG